MLALQVTTSPGDGVKTWGRMLTTWRVGFCMQRSIFKQIAGTRVKLSKQMLHLVSGRDNLLQADHRGVNVLAILAEMSAWASLKLSLHQVLFTGAIRQGRGHS